MHYVAIDIGGTAIKAGVVTSEGILIHKNTVPTPITHYEDLFKKLVDLVLWAQSLCEIHGIAVSQPCVTDSKTGEALSEGALIYIRDTNPAKDLGSYFNLPYAAENDGNCAALAEVWMGQAKHVHNMALVVCGTGIGGAVVIDRKIMSGYRKFAGEFGMFILGENATQKPMSWSELGSTLALVLDYASQSGVSPADLNGIAVFERAEGGDEIAQACIDRFFRIFAYGLHNIQHVYDPELIVLGGAISSRPDFITRLEVALDAFYIQIPLLLSRPNLAVCACGADANMIGAVYHLRTIAL